MVHFYGNDGVCVFKYLVTSEDPQKWFSITLLSFNFVCFICITVSYILINSLASANSQHLNQNASAGNDHLRNRNRKLQTKVSAIIGTDFLCWIPFTAVCWLHFADVIDASSWYPIFSIIILPINSVINPLLYDSTVTGAVIVPARSVARASRGLVDWWRVRSEQRIEETQTTEMAVISS